LSLSCFHIYYFRQLKEATPSTYRHLNVINSGAMTFSFLKTIQYLGTNISLKKLLQNMRTILSQNGYSQVPQLSSGTSINIDNILLSSF
jgi:hypothetical protein